MISIKISDQELDLYPDTEIQMEFTSPFFNWDYVPGEYSYPFTIPASRINSQVLGFPDIIDGVENWNDLDCELSIQGGLVFPGKLKKISAQPSQYEIAIKTGAAIFGGSLKDKSIKDLDYGAKTVISKTLAALKTHMDGKVAGGYPTNKYTYFPMYNPGMVNPTDHPEWSGYLNYFISGGFGPSETPGSNGPPYDSVPNMHPDEVVWPVPTAYLLTVLEAIFSSDNYQVGGIFHEDDDMAGLVINNHQPLGIDMRFYSGSAPNIEHWFPGEWSIGEMLPDISVGEFVNGLRLLFNLAAIFDTRNKTVRFIPIKSIVEKPYDEDWTDKADSKPKVDNATPEILKIGYELNQEDSLVDSLGWWTDFDPASIQGSVSDTTALAAIGSPSTGDTYLVILENAYYRYDGNGWVFLSYNWQSWNNFSEVDQELISPVSTPATIYTSDSDGGRAWKTPYMRRAANLNYPLSGFWKGLDQFPELLFYHGLKQDSVSNNYPLATVDGLDYSGAAAGAYSLSFHGDRGLYEKWWKKWDEFLATTKPVQRKINVNVVDVAKWSYEKKIRINGINYLVDRFRVTFTMKGIKPATFNLLKA